MIINFNDLETSFYYNFNLIMRKKAGDIKFKFVTIQEDIVREL